MWAVCRGEGFVATAQIGAEVACEFSYEWREVGSIATNCKGIRKVCGKRLDTDRAEPQESP